MNTTLSQARELAFAMKPGLEAVEGVRKVVCPPFVSLAAVGEVLRGTGVGLGAQNMFHADGGAYTGEVSPAMLADLCEFVILGHSERRQLFNESDEDINRKVQAAFAVGLTPILCVGERLRDREEDRAESVVEAQLRGCLQGIDSAEWLVVAYEPVWAIGTGRAATPDIAQSMMRHVRSVLQALYGEDSAAAVPLLYGGSVTPDNISEYMEQPDVNGALVGGASLNAGPFVDIIKKAAQVTA